MLGLLEEKNGEIMDLAPDGECGKLRQTIHPSRAIGGLLSTEANGSSHHEPAYQQKKRCRKGAASPMVDALGWAFSSMHDKKACHDVDRWRTSPF